MKLGCYKLYDDVKLPTFGTEDAACFDICAYLQLQTNIIAYSAMNDKIDIACCSEDVEGKRYVEIPEQWRILIPTGLIFDIPHNYSVRIHARSGLSFKQGLVLANSEGIIDSDYVEPTYIMILNVSMKKQKIYHGDRIAQGEMIKTTPDHSSCLSEITNRPVKKTNRKGGFGSTGT